jgi:hypothetical protein
MSPPLAPARSSVNGLLHGFSELRRTPRPPALTPYRSWRRTRSLPARASKQQQDEEFMKRLQRFCCHSTLSELIGPNTHTLATRASCLSSWAEDEKMLLNLSVLLTEPVCARNLYVLLSV